MAYGWGALSFKDFKNHNPATFLQKMIMRTSDRAFKDCFANDGSEFCGFATTPSTYACVGDSGGPLVVRYNGRAFVAGMAHWAATSTKLCKSALRYTKASHYADWIQSAISNW
ncbi:unnamed protein product, partial [Darwinula stevensoni]